MHYLRSNRMFRLKYLVEFYRKTSAELTNNLTTLQVSSAVAVFSSTLIFASATLQALRARRYKSCYTHKRAGIDAKARQ